MSTTTPRAADVPEQARRKAISKRVRYEVLRRDNFTCKYCRSTENELTVDHVVPVSLGGTDDPSNLVAACRDCNLGKTSSSPDAAVVAQVTDDALRWSAAMQVAAGLMRDNLQEEWDYADTLDDEWSGWHYGYDHRPIPRPSDWRHSANAWRTAGLPIDLLTDAARRALGNSKIPPQDTWKYFCGIAWRRITEIQKAAQASLTEPDEDEYVECDGQHSCECQATAYCLGYDASLRRWRDHYGNLQYYALSAVVDAGGWAWKAAG
jgi:hypothetical protein